MRAFKKALMAFAAVTAVSAAFAATSFAANPVANYADGKVTIPEGYITYNDETTQMTVLLIEASKDDGSIAEEDILYINQAAAKGDATFGEMGVKGGELADGNYILKVGSNADGFELMVFDVIVGGSKVKVGDVTCDGAILADDLTELAKYFGGAIDIEAGTAKYDNADITRDGELLANDLTKLARYFGGAVSDEQLSMPGEF